jgi:regulatory protein
LENKSASFNKARAYAYLLLKFRPRSSKEISQRLKRKKIDPKAIKEVIFYLEEKGFLNDREFAKAWIEARIKRGFGLKRIRRELGLKGIDKEVLDAQIQKIKQHYCEKDTLEQLAEQRWRKLSGVAPQKAKQRLFGYLARRGFPAELIIEAVGNLSKNSL